MAHLPSDLADLISGAPSGPNMAGKGVMAFRRADMLAAEAAAENEGSDGTTTTGKRSEPEPEKKLGNQECIGKRGRYRTHKGAFVRKDVRAELAGRFRRDRVFNLENGGFIPTAGHVDDAAAAKDLENGEWEAMVEGMSTFLSTYPEGDPEKVLFSGQPPKKRSHRIPVKLYGEDLEKWLREYADEIEEVVTKMNSRASKAMMVLYNVMHEKRTVMRMLDKFQLAKKTGELRNPNPASGGHQSEQPKRKRARREAKVLPNSRVTEMELELAQARREASVARAELSVLTTGVSPTMAEDLGTPGVARAREAVAAATAATAAAGTGPPKPKAKAPLGPRAAMEMIKNGLFSGGEGEDSPEMQEAMQIFNGTGVVSGPG